MGPPRSRRCSWCLVAQRDPDDAVGDVDVVTADRFDRGQRQRIAGAQVEGGAVQRALDGAAGDVEVTLAERGLGVAAGVVEAEELAADVEDRDRHVVNRYARGGAGRHVLDASHLDPGGHAHAPTSAMPAWASPSSSWSSRLPMRPATPALGQWARASSRKPRTISRSASA